MFRVKRYVVTGWSSRESGQLSTVVVMPYIGQTYSPLASAHGDSIPWTHWVLARSARAARRASIRAHDAMVAEEVRLCGHRLASFGAMARTDAGFNRA